jgi:hypothetical protein
MFILILFAPYFVAIFARSCRLRTQIAPRLAQKSFKIFQKNKFKTSSNKELIFLPKPDILKKNAQNPAVIIRPLEK